ncbi:hypothetical protein BT93_L0047 [Corymbia citriodora subsp. variegata]|uniref:PGG domain-containing protein n=1 Tax=Corymbia citriodora subsp. variegata TaxID=360336 RepID=A0A8T0CUJ6_CORYI|nr:hypothetical protein BT93_L0047 [Corymbia citriodora subsp. variegata]
MAELLLNLGCTGDEPNDAGNTALHLAVKEGNRDLTNLLLDRGSKSVNKMNEEEKCPLYLAVEKGYSEILSRLLQALDGNEVLPSGLSPVHGAVMYRRKDMLQKMSECKKELFDLRDLRRNTPLHLAAFENYVDGVKFLVEEFASSAFEHNIERYLPIHVACKMGHLKIIKMLHQHWLDWLEPEELLTSWNQQNILHIAAKYGRTSVVKYILGDPKLEKLIYVKDQKGNTPLHEATEQWQLEVLFSLTRHNSVILKLVNHRNLTALDIAEEQLIESDAPLHQGSGSRRKPPNIDTLKSRAEVLMIMATLIAGVTFAAGFSVPGGYNGSEPNAGIATLLNKPMYDVFVICNSIAMYNSIIAVVILLWTQINDPHAVFHALGMTRPPLLIALATMSMAFMAGVYVTISNRTWIAVIALIVGITALSVMLILYIALFVPLGYKRRLVQRFADYIIRAVMLISKRGTEGASENFFFEGSAAMTRSRVGERMEEAPAPASRAPRRVIAPRAPPHAPRTPRAPHGAPLQPLYLHQLHLVHLVCLLHLLAAATPPSPPALPAATPLTSPGPPAPPSDISSP